MTPESAPPVGATGFLTKRVQLPTGEVFAKGEPVTVVEHHLHEDDRLSSGLRTTEGLTLRTMLPESFSASGG